MSITSVFNKKLWEPGMVLKRTQEFKVGKDIPHEIFTKWLKEQRWYSKVTKFLKGEKTKKTKLVLTEFRGDKGDLLILHRVILSVDKEITIRFEEWEKTDKTVWRDQRKKRKIF